MRSGAVSIRYAIIKVKFPRRLTGKRRPLDPLLAVRLCLNESVFAASSPPRKGNARTHVQQAVVTEPVTYAKVRNSSGALAASIRSD